MSDAQEIELKLACTARDFDAVLAAAPAGNERTRTLNAVYFDTPERALEMAGATLRVREAGGVFTQTLKRGGGLAREEHEAKVKSSALDTGLGPLRRLLDKAGREALAPVFEIAVTRRERNLSYSGAQIELALDEGEARLGEARTPIAEVELELKSGEPAALFDLARLLADAAPLYLSFEGKADKGRALAGGERPAPEPLPAEISAAGAFQILGRRTLAALTRYAARLREAPDVEAVHQTRVAARRLRSLIVTFRPVLEGPETSRLKDELKWLAKALDQARDLDVFASEVGRHEGAAPVGLADLTGALDAARGAARSKAAMAVSGPRYRRLVIDLSAWLETAAWTRAKSPPAAAFAREALDKRRKHLMKRGKGLEKLTDAERHRARIEAKKLRYAAEGFAELFPGKAAGQFIKRLKTLQDDLGALNDLAGAEPLVGRLDLPAEAAFAAGELVGLKAAERPERLKHAGKALKRLAEADVFW